MSIFIKADNVCNLQRHSLDITETAKGGLSGFQGSVECCGLVPSAVREEAHILQFDVARRCSSKTPEFAHD